jgi:hypothetical protein
MHDLLARSSDEEIATYVLPHLRSSSFEKAATSVPQSTSKHYEIKIPHIATPRGNQEGPVTRSFHVIIHGKVHKRLLTRGIFSKRSSTGVQPVPIKRLGISLKRLTKRMCSLQRDRLSCDAAAQWTCMMHSIS